MLPTKGNPMKIADLKHGMEVEYRLSNRDNEEGTAPKWKPCTGWAKGTLYLRRLEKYWPRATKKDKERYKIGDIIELAIHGIGWASYCQEEYVGDGQFMCDGGEHTYRLLIRGLDGADGATPNNDAEFAAMLGFIGNTLGVGKIQIGTKTIDLKPRG